MTKPRTVGTPHRLGNDDAVGRLKSGLDRGSAPHYARHSLEKSVARVLR
jgi:hypothetical protein